MTTLARVEGHELVVPGTGEVVDLRSAKACAQAMYSLRALEEQIREAKYALTQAVVAEAERLGSKTLELGDLVVEVTGGEETHLDVEVLMELRQAGLPEERWQELVRPVVELRPSLREAKRIASINPRYREIIERATRVVAKPYYLRIRRAR